MAMPSYTFPIPFRWATDTLWMTRQMQTLDFVASGYIRSYTTAQKNALNPGGQPAIIFDNTLGKLCVWTGGAWQTVTSA